MKMKRILCSILCIAMVLGTMGTVVFANETNDSIAPVQVVMTDGTKKDYTSLTQAMSEHQFFK